VHVFIETILSKTIVNWPSSDFEWKHKKLKSSLTARLQRTSLLTNALDSDHNLNENVEPFIHLKDRE
jgi:hypothetical protein